MRCQQHKQSESIPASLLMDPIREAMFWAAWLHAQQLKREGTSASDDLRNTYN